MSGQTVTDSLQFTDDNKHGYFYTGNILSTLALTQAKQQFTTNSEYLNGKLQFYGNYSITASGGGGRAILQIFFNDVMITTILNDYDTGNMMQGAYADLIIPPFTTVTFKIETETVSGADQNCSIVGNFKVGMAPRVGN